MLIETCLRSADIRNYFGLYAQPLSPVYSTRTASLLLSMDNDTLWSLRDSYFRTCSSVFIGDSKSLVSILILPPPLSTREVCVSLTCNDISSVWLQGVRKGRMGSCTVGSIDNLTVGSDGYPVQWDQLTSWTMGSDAYSVLWDQLIYWAMGSNGHPVLWDQLISLQWNPMNILYHGINWYPLLKQSVESRTLCAFVF